MKLINVILIVLLAVIIAQSDPYGIIETDPQDKQKKAQVTDSITTNENGQGSALRIELKKGPAHNHPLFAIWVEDTSGNYIQSLYVSKSIATSIFNYGERKEGAWTNGVVRRPAALPYWGHKRGIQASDGLFIPLPDDPLPDAYSGATPKNDFVLDTRLDQPGPEVFHILIEVNQPWDWNEYWTNNKFPEDEDYKASSQPAVVYRAVVSNTPGDGPVSFELIGHGHYSGKDGNLTADVTTLTTALQIVERASVVVVE
jgi:hypothetical protein